MSKELDEHTQHKNIKKINYQIIQEKKIHKKKKSLYIICLNILFYIGDTGNILSSSLSLS